MSSHIFVSYLGTIPRRCGRMLWHLANIPASALSISGVRSTISWIVLVSVVYTYCLNRLTQDSKLDMQNNADAVPPEYKRRYLAHQRRLRAEKQALAAKREALLVNATFRLFDLPPEVGLLVLAHAADWPATYLALARASRTCQRMTQHACLPRMPVRLLTPGQIRSFSLFIRSQPRIVPLVRNLWMTPLNEGERALAIDIVRNCTNLRSLATSAYILISGMALLTLGTSGRGPGRLSHAEITDLTLVSIRADEWTWLKGSMHGTVLLQQVRRMRVIGPGLSLPPLGSLTHLSYGSIGGRGAGDGREGLACLQDKGSFPVLGQVVFTCPRGNTGGLRVSRPQAGTRLFVVELGETHTELELWCDSVSRRGIWELCADLPAARQL